MNKENFIDKVIEFIKDRPVRSTACLGFSFIFLAVMINCFTPTILLGGIGAFILLTVAIFNVQ